MIGDLVNLHGYVAEIWQVHDTTYDVLLSERNVPFESIYTLLNSDLSKGDIILYKKQHSVFEAYVADIDWPSDSAQIRIIQRDIRLN